MTNPGGSSGLTPGPWGVTGGDGSVPAKQTHNQTNITNQLQNDFTSQQFSGLGGGLIDLVISFITSAIGQILGGFGTVLDAIFGIVDDGFISGMPIIGQHTAAINGATVYLSNHENRIVILESGGQIAEFNSSGTWTKPANMTHHKVILIGGAGGGKGGGNSVGGPGGGQGGWAEHVYLDADLGATESVLIGGGGGGGSANNGSGGTGAPTSFGSHLTAGGGPGNSPTAGSGTRTDFNASGGAGGKSSSGQDGGLGFLCNGGAGGFEGGHGGAGGSPPEDKQGVGGGGGGGSGVTGGTAGHGGAGGFPGGGGGGGGGITPLFGGAPNAGGNGANGRAWIISSPGALS